MTERWVACSQPERPLDEWMMWHWETDCAPCRMKAVAEVRRGNTDAAKQLNRQLIGVDTGTVFSLPSP